MEVFPPDDPQSNEVGSRPTVSQIEQLKSWDDSFASLERVLQAACEKNDSHHDLNSCSRESTVQCIPDTVCPMSTAEIKRKLETDLIDSIESNKQKLNCMSNMIINSGEVTIQLVDSSNEKCDNIPISDLLSIKTESKTKYDDFTFQMSSDKIHSDTKNTIEFIKLDPKPEIKDENLDLKVEKKPDIFPDLDKGSCIKEEENFSSDIKMIVSGDLKNDSGFTDDLSTESKNEFYPHDSISYNLKEKNNELKSECPLLTEVSNVITGETAVETSPTINDNQFFSCPTTENGELSPEEKKEEKEKKEEMDKTIKKEDKLSKKKKFERCNIRDIKLEDELDAVTLSAQKEEQERIRRLQEAQMRALQERLQQIEVEKEALSQLFGQSAGDAPGLFDSNALSEADVSVEKKVAIKTENDVVLVESSDEDKKAKIQSVLSTAIATPIEENIIDISSSSSGNESDSEDSDKKDDDIMVLSDEGEEGEAAEDPNNSGAHTNDCFNLPDEEGRVLVNVGHPPEDPDIFLAPQIAKVIKPHQIGGIRFLYDNVVENLERYKSSPGFGCILAHSMGLGKTVQVVSFVDVFLRHTPATLVLCIVPINTIQNWKAEFDMWVPPSNCVDDALVLSGEVRPRDYNIYTLNENFKTMAARASLIAEWRKNGGVLLMGYEMYRMLALRKMPKIPVKKSKKMKKLEMNLEPETNEQIKKYMEEMYEHIVIPGPDLVICDEGHRIKNSLASTSMALKSIKTRRRVVLTGYPLQNNLLEYWCMVDFVRPNYLGTRAEFCNMFERPISNGQCIDSTPRDRQLMRFRSHVLHSLLVGFVQRRGHSVLRAVLPKKEEHVLLIRMTPIQRQLYKCFVKDLLYVQQATNPLKLFAVCCKIWNHPDILYKLLQEKKAQEDIDLDIDITVAANSAVAGANCGIKKRSYQSKSKVSQRSLKAPLRNLKSETSSFNNGSIKLEPVGCDSGNSQQINDLKVEPHDSLKEEYSASNQSNVPSQNEYSVQGSQSVQNTYSLKSTLNSQFAQSSYDLSFGMQYPINNHNNTQYGSKNNLSSQQINSETASQSVPNIFSQSPTLENQYGQQSQNQFSLGNSQNFPQTDSQMKSPYGSHTNVNQNVPSSHSQSPLQSNFQSKCQSYSSQSSNIASYSQQVDLVNQMQNSNQESFPVQSSSNQEASIPSSPLSTNQKFTSQQYSQNPLQTYNSQISQQPFNSTSRMQFSEQQTASQFPSQSVTNKSKMNYSQISNQTSPMSETSATHSASQSSFQSSQSQSQFARTSQASSLSHQQFSHTSYSQISQPYDQQQPSLSPSQFSQASSNQPYSHQYSQQSSEFTQPHSHQQFQQQNMQTFSDQQTIDSQFHSSEQNSYTNSNQDYSQQTSVQQQYSQQSFSQAFLESGQSYSQQTSQENGTNSFGSPQQFSSQIKFTNKQEQQNFSQTQLNNTETIQYPSPSVGQKQAEQSSPEGRKNQSECNSQGYSEQVPRLPQLPQSNTQSFSEQISNMTSQYSVQQTASLQFPSQVANSSQYSSQTNNQGEAFNNLHFPHQRNDSSEQYVQSSHQYNQQTSQAPQYSQQAEQNTQQSETSQQIDSSSELFSSQTQSDQIPQQNSQAPKAFTQISQNCPQKSGHNINQYNQSISTFTSQQNELTQQFSQLSHPQQYSQHSIESNEQFSQQSSHSPQNYNQTPEKSSQIYGLQSVASTHQYPQQASQSSQEFNQQFNQPSQTSQYNQQSMTSQLFDESVAQTSQMFNQISQQPQQYDSLSSQPSQFNQTTMQSLQQFSDTQPSQQINQSVQSSQHFNQVATQAFDKAANQNPQQYNQSNQTTAYNQSNNQSSQYNPSGNQTSPFNQSANHTSPYSQSSNQTSPYSHSANQASTYNQSADQSSQFNQTTNQSSQYNQSTSQPSQYNQSTNQSAQYNQSTNQSPQYNQSTNQSPQYNQSTNQSPQYNQSTNQSSQCNQSTNQASQYNQSASQPPQYNQSANQSSQQFNSTSQIYNQSSSQTSKQSHQPSPFNQNALSNQQYSQSTQSQFVQKNIQSSQYSQQQYSQTSQSPQHYSQQPAQSPQHFSQPVQSPQQFSQPVQSPQQFQQQPAQSPQQYNQHPIQSPQHFSQPPTPSSQQYQQTAPSPQQFSQPPTPSSQHYQQTALSPQQFSQPPAPSPQQYQPSAPSPQQFMQQSTASPQQFTQPPPPSPQHLSQQPVPSPQQFSQPVPSPQQFSQTVPSPQQFPQTNSSPQQYSQPTPSPQQFNQPTASSQQFSQHNSQQFPPPTPPSQQFSHPSSSPQQFSQMAPSPQQFSQPTPSSQHFSQTNQSPQQYSQPTQSPQSFSQQSTPSQSNSTSQQFSSSSGSSQQLNQQVSQPSPQMHYMQQSPTSNFNQPSSQSSGNSSYVPLSSQSQYKPQSGQFTQYSAQQQCVSGAQTQQFSNSFTQLPNQSSGKSSFQTDYQNQTSVPLSSHGVSNQTVNQQSNKQTSRGCKNKQSRIKPMVQTLPPQASHQSNLKQPPSFSVHAFQNGNLSNALHRNVGQQSIKSLQDSGNSLLQTHHISATKQEAFTLQHIPQDSNGAYSGKCPKAILQPAKQQNQDPILHSQINSDAPPNENELKSVSNESAIVPFRDRMDSSINYEWAVPIMKDYVLGVLENSHKMMVLFVIIAETLQMGDKLLVFSQSLSTLDLLEQFLSKIQVPRKPDQPEQLVTETWSRNKNYFRLDGSTSAQEREKLINEFNRNDNVSLFLLSTRAGCLGINLVGANRIVVMDASWNPCHDAQAVCRIYRYGQKKQCYIYRLVTDNSLEKRIYDRQVNKQGMSDRVVDELNPESNFTWKDVTTLIQDDEDDGPVQELSKFASSYTDKVLKYLVSEMSPSLSKEPFEHESLLLDRKDLKLTKQEKRLAKQSYEMAKRANMINIRTTYTYLPAGSASGGQFIINNKQCQWVGGTTIRVLPNQNNVGAGNARSGTTATPITASPTLMSSLFKQGVMVQKLTMPSNVSIPVLTPGAPPVVIPAGQDVLVLRTPKGVYLRLPDGRIIAVQLPPSLLAKTQFRPNVVTHFRPATPKSGNHSTTVINTPRGQSIGIIKQTLQCGGTVRYLGPRNAAGSSSHNSTRGSAPEVIDLSDDEEPSLRKHGITSNASANSSESESGSGDIEKQERQTTIFPGKHITIRKISSNSSVPVSKEKCEIPQVLSKNKQITILPINPSAQQNRQKFAPQLAQPVRVQQMLLQPQQGKRKPIQKNPGKVQISPLLPGKTVRPQIAVTQTTSSNFQLQKNRHPLTIQPSKNIDFSEKFNEQNTSSTKSNAESLSVKMPEKSSKTSPVTLPQSLQNNKNSSVPISESEKALDNILPPNIAALAINPSLQITPASCTDSSVSDSGPQKSGLSTKSIAHSSSTVAYLQNDTLQNNLSTKSGLQITPTSCPETSDSHLLKAVQHSKIPNQNVPSTSGTMMEQNITVSSKRHVFPISSSSESTTDTLSQKTLYYSSKSPVQNSSGPQSEQTLNVVQSLNRNLQITPVPHSEPSSTSDLFALSKSTVQNSQIDHDIHAGNTSTKSSQLLNKVEISSSQVSIPQTISNKSSTFTVSDSLSTVSTAASSSSSASQMSNKQLQSSTHSSFQQILSTLTNSEAKQKQQTIPYSSHSLPNTQVSLASTASSVSGSQSQHTTSRKRKSSNKQPSKKSQQQHLLMSQNNMLQSQTMDASQPFLHSQISDHLLSENHFPTFPHHISGTDFTTFSNFSSHKTAAHIQHPQPVHPLQHSQEHSLLPHLQHMSHLYPIPPHLAGTATLPDTQPPAPRAWPVPQPSVSSFHPFSQSSPFFSSGQESSQLSFPSSFPLPPSTLTSSLTQSDSNSNIASVNEKSSRISTSNM